MWNHGSILRGVAEFRLSTQSPGTYLIRQSQSHPDSCSLSIRGEAGKVWHMRIQTSLESHDVSKHFCSGTPMFFVKVGARFSAMQALIDCYAMTDLRFEVSIGSVKLRLGCPCPTD